MKKPCAYTHTNTKTGEIFYIGKSGDSSSRPFQLSKTTRNAKWWDYFVKNCDGERGNVKVDVLPAESEGDALKLEWELITKHTPVCNSQYIPEKANTHKACKNMIDLLSSDSIIDATNGMVDMTSFIAQGNLIRLSKGQDAYHASQYLNSSDMQNFISALVDIHGGVASDYLRVEGKGSKARTIADVRIAVKLAMKMDSDSRYKVVDSFIVSNDRMLKGVTEFKFLNDAIDRHLHGRGSKASDTGLYVDVVEIIRNRCALTTRATDPTWNQKSADKHEQSMRYEVEYKLVNLLELGLVRDWEHLKELAERV